jgi:hypothetical protein
MNNRQTKRKSKFIILKYHQHLLLHASTGDSKIKLFSLQPASDINVSIS